MPGREPMHSPFAPPFVTQKLNSMMEVHNEDIAMTATSLWPDDGTFGRRRNNGSFSITHERDVTL